MGAMLAFLRAEVNDGRAVRPLAQGLVRQIHAVHGEDRRFFRQAAASIENKYPRP